MENNTTVEEVERRKSALKSYWKSPEKWNDMNGSALYLYNLSASTTQDKILTHLSILNGDY